MTHPLALALLRAEAAAYRASEGVTGAHPDDPPHPAMLAHRLRGEWQRAGCPVEVEGPTRRPDIMPYSKP